MAVAQASGYSSDLTPSLGTSICQGCGPKKKEKKIYIYYLIVSVGQNFGRAWWDSLLRSLKAAVKVSVMVVISYGTQCSLPSSLVVG